MATAEDRKATDTITPHFPQQAVHVILSVQHCCTDKAKLG
jgi:hypothetical protein